MNHNNSNFSLNLLNKNFLRFRQPSPRPLQETLDSAVSDADFDRVPPTGRGGKGAPHGLLSQAQRNEATQGAGVRPADSSNQLPQVIPKLDLYLK